MKVSHHVSRNDPCPCGSGRKYKNCCLGKKPAPLASPKQSLALYVVLGVAAVVLAIVIGKAAFGPTTPAQITRPQQSAATPSPSSRLFAGTTLPTSRPVSGTPQPPGPAPEGKVWSPEHGHWHDAPGAGGQVVSTSPNIITTTTTTSSPTPQPPGPAPEGKVWSPEHGHWHDAPGAGAAPAPAIPIPATPTSAAPESTPTTPATP